MARLAGHVLSMCLIPFTATLRVLRNPCVEHNNCETDDDEIAAFPELDKLDVYRLAKLDVAPHPQLKNGLVYVKGPKVGGSTFGGIMRRIAYRHGLHHAREPNSWL